MLEHLSHYPAPSYEEERQNIKSHFIKRKNQTPNYASIKNIDKFIDEAMKEHIIVEEDRNVIKYSYTGWYMFGYNDVLKNIENKIILHKKNMKHKIIGIFKSLTFLYLIYIKTVNKLYSPEYIFPMITGASLEDIQNNGGLDAILLDKKVIVPPPS